MGIVAVLQPDARLGAYVADVLAPEHRVLTCPSWTEVHTRLARGGIDALIADADFPDPATALSELDAIRTRYDVPVLVWTEGGTASRFFDLGGIGVDGLLRPSARAFDIRGLLASAIAEGWGRIAASLLPDHWPAEAAAALQWAVAHADERTRVESLAEGIDISPSRLRELLREAKLPTPNQLLLWGRLIMAAARLEDPNRTVESVAYSVGYATPGALSRAVRRHAGLSPVRTRDAGGMRAVVLALVARHEQSRGSVASGALPLCWAFGGLLVAALLTGCAGGPSVDRGAVDRILDTPPMDQLHAGVLVVDAETGRTLYAHNDRRRFIPASNQKVLVTATALSLLGAEYRYSTDVLLDGRLVDGVVHGNLIVRASGDPSFSSRYWDSGRAALRALADSVSAAGIERITGRVVVDATPWDSATVGPTWEFADLPYRYGATGSIFAIDEGEIELVVESGPTVGATATVTWSPGSDEYVRPRVETVPADSGRSIQTSYLPESRRLVVQGGIPLGRTDTLYVAQRDPVGVALEEASNAFGHAGIEVEQGWEVDWGDDAAACGAVRPRCERAVASISSPPLAELVAGILEPSQNWMTEQLIRTLGAHFGEEGSWAEGTDVVERFLVDDVGVDSMDLSPRDGSGLSAYNLVTPRAMVRVLQAMADGPYASEFRSAMAEPSEEGSTLEERLTGLEGRVFAKTGTISNVNSLSGYLVGTDGRGVIFSVLTNGSGLPASRIRPMIDDIVRELARTSNRP